ncbi:MAG: hypothetical protein ACRDBX_03570, partial [Erysipelotrichaceae bacterium]
FLQKNKTTPTTLSHDMYMDELKQMFVRGEISDVEFMHRRDVLNGNVSAMHHQAKEANHEAVSEEKGEPHENV